MEANLKKSENIALQALSEDDEAHLREILLKMRKTLLDNSK